MALGESGASISKLVEEGPPAAGTGRVGESEAMLLAGIADGPSASASDERGTPPVSARPLTSARGAAPCHFTSLSPLPVDGGRVVPTVACSRFTRLPTARPTRTLRSFAVRPFAPLREVEISARVTASDLAHT